MSPLHSGITLRFTIHAALVLSIGLFLTGAVLLFLE